MLASTQAVPSSPGARSVTFPEAAHMVPMEEPRAFLETVGAFLRTVPEP